MELTEEIMQKGESFRINHRGLSMGLEATVEFLILLQRWIGTNKKFRVTLDYDPEWAAMIHFRLLDETESAEMDKLNPTIRNNPCLSRPRPCRNRES